MSPLSLDVTAVAPRRALRYVGDRLLGAFGLLAMVLALVALAALIYDILHDGVGRLSWAFITSIPSRRRRGCRHSHGARRQRLRHHPERGDRHPVWHRRGHSPRGVRRSRPIVADDRDQHRESGGRAVDHLRPARPRAVRPDDVHGTERAGRGVHARTAGAAGRHHFDARGAARGAQVAPRSIVCARRDQMADDLESGAAGGVSGYPHRPDPRPVEGHRRDGTARSRSVPSPTFRSCPRTSSRPSRFFRSRSSTGSHARRPPSPRTRRRASSSCSGCC